MNPSDDFVEQRGRALTFRDAGIRALTWREYTKPHAVFSTRARDAIEIRGVHLQCGSPTLLIYCHGFLGGKNYSHIQHWAQMLNDDMDVIVFDFRGHGESGGATTLGDKEVLDLAAVLNYAARFDYARVVIMGSSMGGAVAIRFAAAAPEVDAVITIGAFAHKDFSRVAMAGLVLLKWSVSRRVLHRTCTTRIERAQPPYNPRDFVSKISPRPLLLIHGEYDSLIPLSHARELFAKAREPKQLHVVRRGGHDTENLNLATKKIITAWLDVTAPRV